LEDLDLVYYTFALNRGDNELECIKLVENGRISLVPYVYMYFSNEYKGKR